MKRRCGTCTLCCNLLAVQEIAKPALTMCNYCTAGQGCHIYESRPRQCRLFNCYFLENSKLNEDWRPSKSHIVLVKSPDGQRIGAHVDPSRPGAWQRKPFYSQLKAWARDAVTQPGPIGQVLVTVGQRTFVILPDRDVDVGIVQSDEIVVTEGRTSAEGMTFDAFKMKKNDPRAAPILRGNAQTRDAFF